MYCFKATSCGDPGRTRTLDPLTGSSIRSQTGERGESLRCARVVSLSSFECSRHTGPRRVRGSNQFDGHLIAERKRPDPREAEVSEESAKRKGLKSVLRDPAAMKGIGASSDLSPRTARYGKPKPCKTALVDARMPASDQKQDFTITGGSVSECPDQHVHIAIPHDFNFGVARQQEHLPDGVSPMARLTGEEAGAFPEPITREVIGGCVRHYWAVHAMADTGPWEFRAKPGSSATGRA